MPNFAVISNNQVINVIVADTKDIAESVSRNECILSDELGIGIGWVLNLETNEWVSPSVIEIDEED
jgi:hypothetical protein